MKRVGEGETRALAASACNKLVCLWIVITLLVSGDGGGDGDDERALDRSAVI